MDGDGGGGRWGWSFCTECKTLIDDGLGLVSKMEEMASHLAGIKFKILESLFKAQVFEFGDGHRYDGRRNSVINEIRKGLGLKPMGVSVGMSSRMVEEDESGNGIGYIIGTTSLPCGGGGGGGGESAPVVVVPSILRGDEEEEERQTEDEEQLIIEREMVGDIPDPLLVETTRTTTRTTHGGEGEDFEEFEYQMDPFSDQVEVEGQGQDQGHHEDYDNEVHVDRKDWFVHDKLQAEGEDVDDDYEDVDENENTRESLPSEEEEEDVKGGDKGDEEWQAKVKKRKLKYFQRRPAKRNFNCVLCNVLCGSAYNLGLHYSTIHDNPTTWICYECGEGFEKKEKLYTHRKSIHKNLPINRDEGGGGGGKLPLITRKRKILKRFQPKSAKSAKQGQLRHFMCLLCDQLFDNAINLGQHYAILHKNQEHWPCSACGEVFEVRDHLYVHRKAIHKNLPVNQKETTRMQPPPRKMIPQGGNPHQDGISTPIPKPRQYVCVLCDVLCDSPISLGLHYSKGHQNPATWPCLDCGEIYGKKEQLYYHRKSVHGNFPGQGGPQKVDRDNSVVKIPPRKQIGFNRPWRVRPRHYVCLLCDQVLDNPNSIGIHYSSVHNNPTKWPCNECGKEFAGQKPLYKHRVTIHKNLPINKPQVREVGPPPPAPPAPPPPAEVNARRVVPNPKYAPTTTSTDKPKPAYAHTSTMENYPHTTTTAMDTPSYPHTTTTTSTDKPKQAHPTTKKKPPKFYRHLMCILCDEFYPNSLALGLHYSNQHGSVTNWPCNECGQEFDGRKKLYYHRRDIHKNMPVNHDVRSIHHGPLLAKEEGNSSSTQAPTATFPAKASKIVQKKKKRQKNLVCLLCDMYFQTIPDISNHYKEIHPHPSWECHTCHRVFDKKNSLYVHRRDFHQNLLINQSMGSNVKREDGPVEDIATRKEKTPKILQKTPKILQKPKLKPYSYICLLCDAMFSRPPEISKHYKESHPNPEWRCFSCYRVSKTKHALYMHRLKVHNNLRNRVFKEDHQGVKFQRRENTNGFSQVKLKVAKILKKRKKKRNYDCVICQENCKSSLGVMLHYKQEHPTLSKRLKCTECSRIFNSYNTLFSHKRHYHKIVDMNSSSGGGGSGSSKVEAATPMERDDLCLWK